MLKIKVKPMQFIPLIRLFSLMALLMFSQASSAERWYHVELIVFEQLDSVSDELAPVATVPNASLTPNSNNDLIQPAANATLNESAAKLKNSQHYQVRYHQAWEQPIKTKSEAQAISINNAMLNGRVRLHKGTYLYATVDLQLNTSGDDHKPYLKQSRRVRSGQLQFFDHPNLGALLKLTPLESKL